MAPIRLRPRFRLTVPMTIDDLTQILQGVLAQDAAPAEGKVLREFVVLRIPEQQQHFWSPELTLQLHEAEGGGTLIRGLFGPRPAVWTMFAGFYSFAFFLSLMALLFGLSQWSLGMEPMGLWVLPIPVVLLISAFATALVGQRLGHDQMGELRDFLDAALAGNVEGSSPDAAGADTTPPIS